MDDMADETSEVTRNLTGSGVPLEDSSSFRKFIDHHRRNAVGVMTHLEGRWGRLVEHRLTKLADGPWRGMPTRHGAIELFLERPFGRSESELVVIERRIDTGDESVRFDPRRIGDDCELVAARGNRQGTLLAVECGSSGGTSIVYLIDLATGKLLAYHGLLERNGLLDFSACGSRLYFIRRGDDERRELWEADPRSGEETLRVTAPVSVRAPLVAFFDPGSGAALLELESNRERRLVYLTLSDGTARTIPQHLSDSSRGAVAVAGERVFITENGISGRGLVSALTFDRGRWIRDVVAPEDGASHLLNATFVGTGIVTVHGSPATARWHSLDGSGAFLVSEGVAACTAFGWNWNPDSPELVCREESPIRPSSVRTLGPRYARRPQDDLVERIVTVEGLDGTEIPVSLYHRRTRADGAHPVLIWVYGAHGVTPSLEYSPLARLWVELGGTYVEPFVRGGGGPAPGWGEAGRGVEKRTAIHDVLSVSRALVRLGLAEPGRIGIGGKSAGASLAAMAIAHAPWLFGAGYLANGLYDLLDHPALQEGRLDACVEFGDPRRESERELVAEVCPLAAVTPGTPYPPLLVVASGDDEVVNPLHTVRFVSAMEAASTNPVVLLWNEFGGHALGGRDDRAAEILIWMAKNTGLEITGSVLF